MPALPLIRSAPAPPPALSLPVVEAVAPWVSVEAQLAIENLPRNLVLDLDALGPYADAIFAATGVTEGGKVIETSRVLAALNQADWELAPSGYVAEWIISDADRPWPPVG